ncbi:MAG TPA: hypothetical protein VGM90_00440 [Kofleriaceae bacterium]|jgi:hypothetical protein
MKTTAAALIAIALLGCKKKDEKVVEFTPLPEKDAAPAAAPPPVDAAAAAKPFDPNGPPVATTDLMKIAVPKPSAPFPQDATWDAAHDMEGGEGDRVILYESSPPNAQSQYDKNIYIAMRWVDCRNAKVKELGPDDAHDERQACFRKPTGAKLAGYDRYDPEDGTQIDIKAGPIMVLATLGLSAEKDLHVKRDALEAYLATLPLGQLAALQ